MSVHSVLWLVSCIFLCVRAKVNHPIWVAQQFSSEYKKYHEATDTMMRR